MAMMNELTSASSNFSNLTDLTTPDFRFNSTGRASSNVENVTIIEKSFIIYITTPYLLRIIFYVIATCGITLNIFTITIIFIYKPMLKQLMNVFIINQAIIDALAATILIISTIFPNNPTKKRAGYVPDEALCRIWYSQMFMWAMLLSSTYGTIAVTFERYLAVVHPIWHKAKFTRKMAFIMIIIVWLVGPCYYYSYALATSEITATGICSTYTYYQDVVEQHFSAAFEFIINYVFPLLSLAYFYAAMILALRKIVPLHPQGVVAGNDGKKAAAPEVGQGIKNTDKAELKNKSINPEINNRHFLTALATAVNMEGLERTPKDTSSSAVKLSSAEMQNASKAYVVQVAATQMPDVNLQETLNGSERVEAAFQRNSPTLLKNEKNNLSSNTGEKNKKGGQIESKLTSAPKESLSTARAKRNVIKTLALVSCGFILCWTWAEVSFFVNDIGLISIDWSGTFYNFTTVMAFSSCCINPVVYCIQYKQFQRGVKYVLHHNRVWKHFFGGSKIDTIVEPTMSRYSVHKSK